MIKFEQVSSDGHQVSLAWGPSHGVPCVMSGGVGAGARRVSYLMPRGQGQGCIVRSNASWVMVTWNPVCGQNDRHGRKYYLLATSLVKIIKQTHQKLDVYDKFYVTYLL